MRREELLRRISALLLTLVMTVSMSDFVFADVFAESETDQTEVTEQAAYDGEVSADADGSEDKEETSGSETVKIEAEGTDRALTADADLPAVENIEVVSFANNGGKLEADLSWDAYAGASSYRLTVGSADSVSVKGTQYRCSGLDAGLDYAVRIDAVSTKGISVKTIASSDYTLRTYIGIDKESNITSDEKLTTTAGKQVYNNSLTLSFSVPGATSCSVKMEGISLVDEAKKFENTSVSVEPDAGGVFETTFDDLYPSRKYRFSVTAYCGDDVLMTTKDDVEAQPELKELSAVNRTGGSLTTRKWTFADGGKDLRSYAGQTKGGYAVAQGGATDGTYACILLVSSKYQDGKVAKVKISDHSYKQVSKVLPTTHGNGMTYDTRRDRLVIIGRDDDVTGRKRKQQITVIDAKTLSPTPVMQKNLDYSIYEKDEMDEDYFKANQRSKGLAAISYSPKYDLYIAKQRENNNLIAIDPDTLKAVGLIKTLVNQYGGAGQAMDGDDQYVYMLKSGYGSGNDNIILTLDWNAEGIMNDDGTRKAYHSYAQSDEWWCTNDRYPIAVYKINTPHEGENVFHTFDAEGEHFFMTEYDANQQYDVKKVTRKYKVKWKKVKKKVRVKVKKKKKVKKKVNGKWKKVKVTYYKYKWKKKKVWLYRTKSKTVTVKTPTYKDRKDYIYDLGNM